MPGGSRSCLAVRLPDELLAAVPPECDRDEDHGEPDVTDTTFASELPPATLMIV